MENYISVLKQYANFSGRARRQEYWMFFLVNILIYIALAIVISVLNVPALTFLIGIYALATLVPALALTVRRLHDTGRSGWWIFVQMIPAVGGIVFLVFVCLDSQIGSNEYGPNPKGVAGNPIAA
ncbi:DUF805 domain-containing protein [Gallaecimonas pentaromativorans]|uniref:Uncharacterized membrane protein YhaH (DUF805 family) n=1 Tax=Gallaecimonas pentaromativorans TaxID=584787 RepID=A0A3N1NRM0_9GAMM|nr:DUF805 domain-containing protein [Gallaecimonas pentaromativorans]MED5524010.1 DUF805 domain-containing protein [Pseudomonadota bacterium]ROQ22434.1 uncharacterized membrane protein YhaH (DUF805 family) [Gallaecimonas pentaromativorans]